MLVGVMCFIILGVLAVTTVNQVLIAAASAICIGVVYCYVKSMKAIKYL